MPFSTSLIKGLSEPVIYGAVGSTYILEGISEFLNVQVAYVRFNEGAGALRALTNLWN